VDVVKIPAKDILVDDEFNCREEVTSSSIFQLAADIEKHGLQQPVSVRPLDPNDPLDQPYLGTYKYALFMGFRRTKACLAVAISEIPAMIKNVTREEAKILNLGENLHRKDLSFYEEALSISKLYEAGMGRNKIADAINQSLGWVQRRLQVFNLPLEGIALVRDGIIGPAQIEILNSYKDKDEQKDQIRKIRHDWQMHAKHDAEGNQIFKVSVPKPKTGKAINRSTHKYNRKPAEVRNAIAYLRHVGVPDGPWYRALAWASGGISDKELLTEFKEFVHEYYEEEIKLTEDQSIPAEGEY
jgi:ParB/RepB/Spo0J family partition protein